MRSSRATAAGSTWVLDHQGLTLMVAVATLVLTAALYIVIPKGFFPIQDTGLIQGISEAAQSVSYGAMAEQQEALAEAVLKDPDVVSLSSFIGVDGTNTTLNSGRDPHQPQAQGRAQARCHRPSSAGCKRETANVSGISLYMQPVQDLTIDTTREPHPVPIHPRGRRSDRARRWVPKLVDRLNHAPELADVASDLAAERALRLHHHRPRHRRRFGITPATVDNALYDAFGQRIVSTIFTQSNQYRVILENDPALQTSVRDLSSI